jgi:hypothetical protein
VTDQLSDVNQFQGSAEATDGEHLTGVNPSPNDDTQNRPNVGPHRESKPNPVLESDTVARWAKKVAANSLRLIVEASE